MKMPRRRKLNKDYEKLIGATKKEVELITAKIRDIYDDDIREEYARAFFSVKSRQSELDSAYIKVGYDDRSEELLKLYKDTLSAFHSEY